VTQAEKKERRNERRQAKIQETKRRTRNRRLSQVGIGALVIGAIFAVMATRPTPQSPAVAEGRASAGQPAPNIEMVDFDGEQVTLSQYTGTPVVLNFWASWCPFCIAEMPDFERVSQATAGDVVFIGVNLQDNEVLATELVGETGVTYRLTRDPQGVVYAAFGGIAMPTTVFVDATGVVSEVVTGQLSEDQLRAKIAEHFGVGT